MAKYDMVRPCADCPFRTDVRPYLTNTRADEIVDAIRMGGEFPCHKTVDYDRYTADDEYEQPYYNPTGDESQCAGALVIMEANEEPNQMVRIVERLGMYDRRKLDMASPVFDTFEDFIEAQEAR